MVPPSPARSSEDDDDFSPLPHLRRQLCESRTALQRAEARVLALTHAAAASQESAAVCARKLSASHAQVDVLQRELRHAEYASSLREAARRTELAEMEQRVKEAELRAQRAEEAAERVRVMAETKEKERGRGETEGEERTEGKAEAEGARGRRKNAAGEKRKGAAERQNLQGVLEYSHRSLPASHPHPPSASRPASSSSEPTSGQEESQMQAALAHLRERLHVIHKQVGAHGVALGGRLRALLPLLDVVRAELGAEPHASTASGGGRSLLVRQLRDGLEEAIHIADQGAALHEEGEAAASSWDDEARGEGGGWEERRGGVGTPRTPRRRGGGARVAVEAGGEERQLRRELRAAREELRVGAAEKRRAKAVVGKYVGVVGRLQAAHAHVQTRVEEAQSHVKEARRRGEERARELEAEVARQVAAYGRECEQRKAAQRELSAAVERQRSLQGALAEKERELSELRGTGAEASRAIAAQASQQREVLAQLEGAKAALRARDEEARLAAREAARQLEEARRRRDEEVRTLTSELEQAWMYARMRAPPPVASTRGGGCGASFAFPPQSVSPPRSPARGAIDAATTRRAEGANSGYLTSAASIYQLAPCLSSDSQASAREVAVAATLSNLDAQLQTLHMDIDLAAKQLSLTTQG